MVVCRGAWGRSAQLHVAKECITFFKDLSSYLNIKTVDQKTRRKPRANDVGTRQRFQHIRLRSVTATLNI
ncbi:MAG TPA: hypothetical protein DD001_01180 [Microcoleaceae bacterium UBA10368]|jgi:hypothetical protein|nr:hypothetical protein [Microcoleaceae cyanobacterium UBA10368]HCV29261.1 hypothetical protein [Microcoleaceae cyanobacterium UBA9251]